jgi:hypothetical protein
MANVVVSALATWNGKALKKAKQDVDVFNKQLKTLARTFGVTFSAAAIVSFSKKAIKAFTEDEAAAKRLALQLENTGNAFRVDEVEGYIKSLEKTNAILTDLRAPFQTLLNLTGSVELAQRSLEAALNISAGTGENLNTVISAIASGIRGQTKAIKNLNTGIDSNIIATGDMNQIMEALEKRFSGQSAARLDTYAGKMDVLRKGADEATKSIGTGLVNALTTLSKDNSVESLATNFENLGNNIAFAIEEMAKLIKKFDDLVNNPSFAAGLLALAALSRNPKILAAALGTVGLNAASNVALGGGTTSTSSNLKNANARENRLQLAQIKTGTTYRKLENEQLKKKTEVDKLAEKFDLERIGLMKALNETTDAETKLRIQAKIAILDNNEALAKKINAELEAAKKVEELGNAFTSASQVLAAQTSKLQSAFDSALNALLARIATAGFMPPASVIAGLSLVDQLRIEKAEDAFTALNLTNPEFIASMASERQAVSAISGGGNQFSLSFDTTFTGDRFTQLIAESLQLSEKTGYSTSPAGSLNP